jgi:uncharacterized coiled-coil protein SlyX
MDELDLERETWQKKKVEMQHQIDALIEENKTLRGTNTADELEVLLQKEEKRELAARVKELEEQLQHHKLSKSDTDKIAKLERENEGLATDVKSLKESSSEQLNKIRSLETKLAEKDKDLAKRDERLDAVFSQWRAMEHSFKKN